MAHQFNKHYTRDEARALLPQVRKWLEQLEQARDHLLKYDKRLSSLMEPGRDAGGDLVNSWARTMADFRELMGEFQRREILIKDIDRGLLDFPGNHRRQGSFSVLGKGRGGHRILARPGHRLRRPRAPRIVAADVRTRSVVPTPVNLVNIHAPARPIIIPGEAERPAGAVEIERPSGCRVCWDHTPKIEFLCQSPSLQTATRND